MIIAPTTSGNSEKIKATPLFFMPNNWSTPEARKTKNKIVNTYINITFHPVARAIASAFPNKSGKLVMNPYS